MTLLFRSKSCKLGAEAGYNAAPPSPSVWEQETEDEYEEDEEETEEEYDYEDGNDENEEEYGSYGKITNPISTPFRRKDESSNNERGNNGQLAILDFVVAALRKSLLVTCSVEREELSSLDISRPTDVQHVSHVTFDRFNGFLGLPHELEPELPTRVPSASASVFGVSSQSMQCSIDERGNSVPTLLLMMQKRLYAQGGLQAEGIFRINAENSQEECVRDQLNRGVVPRDIDVHCLAGLIKAWFRELPTGVLDSLKPEQVMHCNTEDQCTQLVKQLPATEAGLLDWAINLMADVVQSEHHNKMNARNIAMVFAPNMTQMADPLTALIHAVQVMNLLKTLIERTLRLRDESAKRSTALSSSTDLLDSVSNPHTSISFGQLIFEKQQQHYVHEQPHDNNLFRSNTLDHSDFSEENEQTNSEKKYSDEGKSIASISVHSSPVRSPATESVYESAETEGILDRLNFRKGVKKLCRHPVFQLSKPSKKTAELGDCK